MKASSIRPVFSVLAALIFLTTACSQQKDNDGGTGATIPAETFAISNSKLQNCHFKVPAPSYSAGGPITPNPIQCDAGVATKVQLLSPTPLPTGLQFSMDSLSLTGSTIQKIASTTYQFYLENEAGYVMINLQLTVK